MAARAYVYILASKPHGTLYIGVTGALPTRVEQHKAGVVPGFTAKYGVNRLVWFEGFADIRDAIDREKAMKKWNRKWKIELIENPIRIGMSCIRGDWQHNPSFLVVPAKAGTHASSDERSSDRTAGGEMGPRLRGDDNLGQPCALN